ncbi:PREDICTED: RNA-binding protein 40-like [Priapulus caudatus]|uniref:RNA-binding region-containing protein 3 n=1 Tax=Priapulus caudatus TaxID=37621 RepID=A0ABM1EQF8_PRICU|nr:PREDICTED: RNA-binding protein 40-like [Priapulus caudatus]
MADLIDTTSRVVIIRHLPADLSTEEKEDFLKHFGAKCVKCMGTTGRMKHTAFATFPSEEEACKAIKRLHQLEILGHKLVVEYAKQQHQEFVPSESEYKRLDPLKDTKVSEVEKKKKKKRDTVDDSLTELQKKLDAVAPHLGLTYAASARLRYRYPQPNVTILTNIANALASVPRFYTQVLHLMNKMNLPAPFSVITATPDVPLGQEVFEGRQEAEDMELGSSPESSELESEGERRDKPDRVVPILQKRPARRKARPIAKRPRLQQLIKMPEAPPSGHVSKPEEVFELPTGQTAKKLEIRISSETDAANSMFDDYSIGHIPVVGGRFRSSLPPT